MISLPRTKSSPAQFATYVNPVIWGILLTMPYCQEDIARIQEHTVDADLRVSEQIDRIERMIEKGHDVTEAEGLLRHLEAILEQWHVRSKIILDAITHG